MKECDMAINLSLVGEKSKEVEHSYGWKDVVLYHLGIGAKAAELQYVYEGVKGGVKVIPTFSVIPALEAVAHVMGRLGANPMMILHGEQGMTIAKPIPVKGNFKTTATVLGIYDKVKGALAQVETATTDDKGELLFTNYVGIFCRGEGGFGGEKQPDQKVIEPPAGKEPDFTGSYAVSEDQCALYRLSGDLNPLHIDPNFAKIGGFPKPILHGLCSYGIACKTLIKGLCNDDPLKVREWRVRFTKPVMPGETITTKAWKLEDGLYAVEASTENNQVITQAHFKCDA
jgi:acyl dehydratase